MALRSFVRRLSRALERFNDSFGGVAAATGVERSQGRGVNPDAVVAVLGEVEKREAGTEKAGDRPCAPTR